jgi:polyisoprenoid-binding protein YceI
MKKTILSLVLPLGLTFAASAQNLTYTVGTLQANGVKFAIPYTAGVHEGTAKVIQGQVVLNGNKLETIQVSVPIDSMSTGNITRDCHMREALGIDYTNSEFPAQHVCDSNNKTPATGPNSVVFPTIEFLFQAADHAQIINFDPSVADVQKLAVVGKITMHGISQAIKVGATEGVQTTVTRMAGTDDLRLQTQFEVVLDDHKVQVKPFKLGPIEIGVGKKAKVTLDLVLKKQK